MDISAPSPISTQATLAAHTPARKAPDQSKVPPSDGIGRARTDPQPENGHSQYDAAADARQQQALREKLRDPTTPTGPPPTFQFTLLEVEQDLRNILARIEAVRSQDRDAAALRTTGENDQETDASALSPPPTTQAGRMATSPDASPQPASSKESGNPAEPHP